MTLSIERSASGRRVTWLTLIGVLLLPVVIGGLLVAALYNPSERLENINAAIVNNDDGVEIDGQFAPLGRQLTAGLVEGSDDLDSNVAWTISNTEDAADGLASGDYAAIITIPENFSAAATSTAPGGTPERATIDVQTAPDGKVVDDAITATIAQTAASVFGGAVSTTYLENVLLGFTTLGDQLGEAASGAHELAGGAGDAASGADQLATGAASLADGAGQVASGSSELAGGAGALATGAGTAASGLTELSSAAGTIASGQGQVADALSAIASQVPTDIPTIPQELIDAANDVAASSTEINQQLTDAANNLTALAAGCDTALTPELCADLTAAADAANAVLPTVTDTITNADVIADGLAGINALPQLGAALTQLASESQQLAAGSQGIADGAAAAASGVGQLASGATELSGGASALASGAGAIASGGSELSTGAGTLATGVDQIAGATGTLADGLDTAVAEIPSYTDDEAATLASVVADPVSANGLGTNLFGASAIPLLAMVVLWFGGLASFVVLRATPARALVSRAPSALLALGAFLPGAVIGAAQGLFVAIIVQIASSYAWGEWSLFALLCIASGIAFAAVNQALVAVFGGAGRWIAAIVGALALATGIVSTVPAGIAAVAGMLPTAPAYSAMLAALTPAGGLAAGFVGLVVWGILALIVTTLAVTRRRTASPATILG